MGSREERCGRQVVERRLVGARRWGWPEQGGWMCCAMHVGRRARRSGDKCTPQRLTPAAARVWDGRDKHGRRPRPGDKLPRVRWHLPRAPLAPPFVIPAVTRISTPHAYLRPVVLIRTRPIRGLVRVPRAHIHTTHDRPLMLERAATLGPHAKTCRVP